MRENSALLTSDQREIFLQQLRQETAGHHKDLENTWLSKKLLSPDLLPLDYALYLSAMQQVMLFTEENAFPYLLSIIPDLVKRKKTAWLTADLQNLAVLINEIPAFKPQIATSSPSYFLGMMYVIEGSTLGGRVILKQLPAQLQNSTHFFSGYGNETGPMWKSFISNLTGYAILDENRQLIIEGVKDMFQYIHAYFNQIEECI